MPLNELTDVTGAEGGVVEKRTETALLLEPSVFVTTTAPS